MHYSYKISKKPLSAFFVFAFVLTLSLGVLLFVPPKASALTLPEAKKICAKKANEAACLKNIETCRRGGYKTECLEKKVVTGGSVVPKQCTNASDPQACQTACKPKTGAARTACLAGQGVSGAADSVKEGVGSVQEAADKEAFSLSAKGEKPYTCGSGENAVKTSINFGCTGTGNPIEDFAYAIIKFLSFGVGLVIVASIIYAGIQYTSSTGNPEATSKAKARILNAVIGLFFYFLIFALIQYLVPGGLFKP